MEETGNSAFLLPQCANAYIITHFETQTIKLTATPVHSLTQHCIFIQCQRDPTPFIHYFLLWFIILQRLKLDWKWLPVQTSHTKSVIFQILDYVNCNYTSKHRRAIKVCESSCKQWPVLKMVDIRCKSYVSKTSARMSQAAKCKMFLCRRIFQFTTPNILHEQKKYRFN